MQNISMKFESGVGFSKGWALLALKKPPPLVPHSLMISCDATGPCAIIWSVTVWVTSFPSGSETCTCCGSTSLTGAYGFRVLGGPLPTRQNAPQKQGGRRNQN